MGAWRSIGVAVIVLAAGAAAEGQAEAQTPRGAASPAGRASAQPGAAAQTSVQAAPSATARATTGSIAPPEEEGWTVVQLPGGYMRYRTEPQEQQAGAAPEEQGGVTIEPSAAAPRMVVVPAPGAAAVGETGGNLGRASNYGPNLGVERLPQPPCLAEQQALAHRLMYLRGLFYIDPATALLVLPTVEPALGPAIQMAMFGQPAALQGSNLLETAVSSDLWARERARALAECLQR